MQPRCPCAFLSLPGRAPLVFADFSQCSISKQVKNAAIPNEIATDAICFYKWNSGAFPALVHINEIHCRDINFIVIIDFCFLYHLFYHFFKLKFFTGSPPAIVAKQSLTNLEYNSSFVSFWDSMGVASPSYRSTASVGHANWPICN